MIYGIGNDVLETERVVRIMKGDHSSRFLSRVLTEEERAVLGSRMQSEVQYVSGRFAAKEAISKAFGCGIGELLGFQDIEILPNELGKPTVTISGAAWKRLGLGGEPAYMVHLSISHQPSVAAAFAIVERI
ncbi:holo-ACP synthase [Paenibacillus provencensis]|uniref:Holo-[acyl-carrier-protein] synthase n=1 Tax=Paenibacillus provencensis TaxID=441151 RepID=A0ABW3PX41_9BACL|nr:holo-ACP synthase [Paenibacillus sp. MER 78]MCM3129470.1 holo-ACP synthase [Paenibacillus sp. MER 78]